MKGFKPWFSSVRGDCYANYAITTGQFIPSPLLALSHSTHIYLSKFRPKGSHLQQNSIVNSSKANKLTT